jgi:hypothetical protein
MPVPNITYTNVTARSAEPLAELTAIPLITWAAYTAMIKLSK